MLVSNGTVLHRYEEQTREGQPRLGRHHVLDARSLDHTIEKTLAGVLPPIKPAEHLPNITTLNQGHLGSCVGNASTYALGALYGQADMTGVKLDGSFTLTSYDAGMNEGFAVEVYHDSTLEDGLGTPYPPQDRGSSGLGACKALKKAGLISSYSWALTTRGFGALLQRQGVIIGMPWFEAFFQPDSKGFIDHGNLSNWGQIAGGHEIYVEALETWNDRNPGRSVVRVRNSWGKSWGVEDGCFRMKLSTYQALQSQVDIKQFAR